MTTSLIDIKNLSITFRKGIVENPTLHNVSLSIEKGETLALVGESGSGKSITAMSILRLIPTPPATYPTGEILFHGDNTLKANDNVLRQIRGNKISMIFQEPINSLNPLHTIEKQLNESVSLHKRLSIAETRKVSLSWLKRVGIARAEERMKAYPYQLSGGECQRVMIALALINEPDLLIADEPTTALDVTVQAQILELIKKLQQEIGMAILFITHDLGIVKRIADRVAVMKNGRVVEIAGANQIFNAPTHPYTKEILESELDNDPPRSGPEAKPLIAIDALRVWFPIQKGVLRRTVDHIKAVTDISFLIKQGQTLGVVGESGSGKSTAGLAILRLIESKGEIKFQDQNLNTLNRKEKKCRLSFKILTEA